MTTRLIEQLLQLFKIRRDAPPPTDAETKSPGAPLSPPLAPLAKRLNRNALTVAAVLMGMTVLTSVVVVHTGTGDTSASAATGQAAMPMAAPPEPPLLDRPVSRLSDPRAPNPGTDTGRTIDVSPDPFSLAGAQRPAKGAGTGHARGRAYRDALRESAVAATVERPQVPEGPLTSAAAPPAA